jgi:predicted kinase
MSHIIFLRGLPGSGKSEWAKYNQEGDEDVLVLSFDQMLQEYDPVSYDQDYTAAFAKNHREVVNLMMSRLTASTHYTTRIIVDSLNLDFAQVCGLAEACRLLNSVYGVTLVNFFITVEESIRRQQRRKGHTVSEDKVRLMDVALRKVYDCNFPGDVINLRFDTQELITVRSVDEYNEEGVIVTETKSEGGSFAPEKSLLI